MNRPTEVQEVNAETQFDIYNDRIDQIYYNFLDELRNPDDIYKAPVFSGLLYMIYSKLFKPGPNDKVLHNRNSIIDYSNIALLDKLFDKYIYLCSMCGIDPTILSFCVMVGIERHTIDTWVNGAYRNTSKEHSTIAKKWKSMCESSTLNSAAKGSIGAIFIAKAAYGYKEQNTVEVINNTSLSSDTVQQIAERHKTAALPVEIE